MKNNFVKSNLTNGCPAEVALTIKLIKNELVFNVQYCGNNAYDDLIFDGEAYKLRTALESMATREKYKIGVIAEQYAIEFFIQSSNKSIHQFFKDILATVNKFNFENFNKFYKYAVSIFDMIDKNGKINSHNSPAYLTINSICDWLNDPNVAVGILNGVSITSSLENAEPDYATVLNPILFAHTQSMANSYSLLANEYTDDETESLGTPTTEAYSFEAVSTRLVFNL